MNFQDKEKMDDDAEKQIASVMDRAREVGVLYQRSRNEGTTSALTEAMKKADSPILLSGSIDHANRVAREAEVENARLVSWESMRPENTRGIRGQIIPDNYFMERFVSSVSSVMKFLIKQVRKLRRENRDLKQRNENLNDAVENAKKSVKKAKKINQELKEKAKSLSKKVNKLRDGK